MTQAARASLATFLLLTSLFLVADISAGQRPPKDLDAFVEQVRRDFEVPGIGLAIVKDGAIVVAKGYGLADREQSTPVDAHTIFAIASNTKAFTSTALGILVEDGKLKWDDPVVNYLPWFMLSDPYVTREITVRDLLVHRSGLGLGQGDLLLFPPSSYERKEIVRRLRYLQLKTSFRSAYAYDNVLYLVAGELVEAVSGQSWEEFVEKRIFDKIRMTDSKTRIEQVLAARNVAQPYIMFYRELHLIGHDAAPNHAPAGGIYSSAADMAQWLRVQLDSGRVDNFLRLFTPTTTEQLWSYITPIPIGNPEPEMARFRSQFCGYGLGFAVWDYRGHKIVSHGGVLGGYVSRVTMVPGINLGVVVLTNQMSEYSNTAITRHVIDHYLEVADIDWLATMKVLAARERTTLAADEREILATRDSTSAPSLPNSAYAGMYDDIWYGDILIAEEQGKLTIQFSRTPSLVGDLEHWQYDTFIVRWRDRALGADAFITFALNPDGTIDQAKMKAVSPATDFSYDFQDLLLKPVQKAQKKL